MHPLKPFSYVEHCEVLEARCPADHPKARPSLPAPARLDQRGSTNYLSWLHVVLFLGLDVKPRRSSKG